MENEMLKYNLQFFADDPDTGADDGADANDKTDQDKEKHTEKSMEELMLECAKLKRAQEKAASEAAEYKRKWKDTLSEQEKASMEKAEEQAKRDEEFEQLKRENSINKLEKHFLQMGYTSDNATKAATAHYENDDETLFKIQAQEKERAIAEEKAKWLAERPDINNGGDNGETDLFLKGFNSVK